MPEGEQQQQETENLFEQIMKENFPNLAKEIRLSGSPGSPESPSIIKLPKIKYKETNLKAARGKKRVPYKGVPIRLSADFSKKPYRQEEAGKKYLKS